MGAKLEAAKETKAKNSNGRPRSVGSHSVRLKVILLVLLLVIPLVLLGVAGTLYYQGVIRQSINDDQLGSAKTIAAMTPEYMNTSQLYLKSISDRPLVIKAMEENDRSFLRSMAVYANDTDRINSIYFTDSVGTIITSTPEISRAIGGSAIDHDYVGRVLKTGDPVIGDAVPDFDGSPVVPIGVPVKDQNGTLLGVMVGTVDLNVFAHTIRDTMVKNQQFIYVVNRTGHVMVHDNPAQMKAMTDFSLVPGVQNVLRGEAGVAEYYNPIENQSRLSAYAPVSSLGWGVVVALPVDVAYQPVWNATWLAMAIIAVFMLFIIGLGLYVGNGIAAPIISLSQATKKLAETDDYRPLLPLGRKDEIGILARSFDDMVGTIRRENREREQAVENLRESEERERARSEELATVLDAVPAAVWIARDPKAIRIDQNRQSSEWLRIAKEANASKSAPDGEKPETFRLFKDGAEIPVDELPVQQAAAGKEIRDYEFTFVYPDGTKRHVLGNATPLLDKLGHSRGSVAAFVDITERKQVEEAREELLVQLRAKTSELENVNEELEVKSEELAAQAEEMECTNEELHTNIDELHKVTASLRETQDYLESLINYANAPIIVWDPRFSITRFNHAFERLSGYTANEVIGKDLSILFPSDSREESMDKIRKTLVGEQWESVEIPIRHKYGGVHIALWSSANIYSADNVLLATIAQGQDITRRKQAEQALEEAKVQAELYLDLMGHDISNMHQIMMMQLEIAQEILNTKGKLESEDREMIDSSARTLEKAAKLINNVRKLQMLRSGEYGMEAVDLTATLNDALKDYSSIPGRDITIKYAPDGNCLVRANSLLKDVFSNLLDNAVKHSSNPLEIGVEVHKVGLNGSSYYRVAIEDNGNGIPDDRKEEVFHRFRRGQTKAKGTGLGLYLVKSLVEGFGGHVEIENRVLGDYTKGTRFLVYIPAIEGEKNAGE